MQSLPKHRLRHKNAAPNFGVKSLNLLSITIFVCRERKAKTTVRLRKKRIDFAEIEAKIKIKSEDKSLASLSENQLRQPKMSKRSKTRLDEGKNSTSLNILKVKGKSTKSKTKISRRPVTEN